MSRPLPPQVPGDKLSGGGLCIAGARAQALPGRALLLFLTPRCALLSGWALGAVGGPSERRPEAETQYTHRTRASGLPPENSRMEFRRDP